MSYSKDRLGTFGAIYRTKLAEAKASSPSAFMWKDGVTADVVADRMMASITKGGIGSVIIGGAMGATCKFLGIKPTYTAITAYLNGE